jgi:hypothetical protein
MIRLQEEGQGVAGRDAAMRLVVDQDFKRRAVACSIE